jgi:imidazole glycerol-phosphate synthase subunit HisH
MKKSVAIIDYGINNIHSFEKAFKKINVETEIIKNYKDLKNFKYIVLPGVGSFDSGVKNLTEKGLFDEVIKLSRRGHFILGICLGMQLLFQKSEESKKNLFGLSLLKGNSQKLKLNQKNSNIKIPHVGWNTINIKNSKKILQQIDDLSIFYFIHSFYVNPSDKNIVSATCNHGLEFPVVLENQNIIGIQFHPEKCQTNGLKILKNFVNLN